MKFQALRISLAAWSLVIAVSVLLAANEWIRLPEDPLKGWSVFEGKGCIKCHSIHGHGGKDGPDLGEKPFYGSFLQLAGVMWNHSPQMSERMRELRISRPTFTHEEMAELIAYLYYLQYLGEPGNPLEGEKLFPEKGCIKCHSVGGKGGTIGPKLDEMKRYASPLYMAQAMWNHGPEMEVRMKELGIRRPRFEGREIVDLIAYIQKVSAGAPEEKVYMLPGNPTEGERLFVSKGCIDCHSVRGKGASIGPDLGKVELYRSVTEIVGIMWNHGPEMWQEMEKRGINRPRFSGEEMADIIAYLYFLKFVDEPGDRVEGEKLFSSKGCITCHLVKGKGEEIGPDLATSRGVSSPIEMVQVMWNHAPIMEKKMREKRLPWPEFKGKDMPNLFAYLQSISKGGATK